MEANADTLVVMGIISDKVYESYYFQDEVNQNGSKVEIDPRG
ncbi:MAG: hypothetical protein OQK48_04480 [Sulfurimonas sp.]|nr:hypothetical protein [Sulfurimonas sp.]MCW8895992.1 hypothetical protein [Sulfurimonas sp.]MCW8954178.1 hypothetical protein [Sulfurimonas sp.]MCW9066999.1 hypothetical protein [Sulfurimonas sp.]